MPASLSVRSASRKSTSSSTPSSDRAAPNGTICAGLPEVGLLGRGAVADVAGVEGLIPARDVERDEDEPGCQREARERAEDRGDAPHVALGIANRDA